MPVSNYDRSEATVNQPAYRLSNIIKGDFDPYITDYARAVKAYHGQVMIRLAHEMNGNWYPWGSTFNTPEEYIAAWRHVHELFTKEGATNATWVWAPNAIYYEKKVPFSSKITAFYPGDAYVDWVGFSAFNWAGQYKQNVWRTPEEIYAETVSTLKNFHKPILIAETATADVRSAQRKVDWIESLALYMKSNPSIKGIIWFNTEDKGIDWRLESSDASLKSYTTSFDSYFLQNSTL